MVLPKTGFWLGQDVGLSSPFCSMGSDHSPALLPVCSKTPGPEASQQGMSTETIWRVRLAGQTTTTFLLWFVWPWTNHRPHEEFRLTRPPYPPAQGCLGIRQKVVHESILSYANVHRCRDWQLGADTNLLSYWRRFQWFYSEDIGFGAPYPSQVWPAPWSHCNAQPGNNPPKKDHWYN